MVRRPEPEPSDHDDQVGEAIEAYLALAEAGTPPEPEAFAGRYPGIGDDLLAALEGLALVKGLVGEAGGHGPGARLETGRRIAGYRIVRELGRGGMGVVYEAVHVALDRPVALKVLGSQAAPDSGGRRRFLNEARTAAGLHHTHIVPVFDVGQVGGLCYYAMQRIEGSGLDRVVRHLRRDRATAAGSASGGSAPPRARPWGRLSSWHAPRGLNPSPRPGAGPGLSLTGPWPRPAPASGLGAHADDLSGSGGLAGAAPGDEDDGPPPFEPPRGSAYYRWVAEVGRAAAEALGHAHQRGVIHRDVKPSNLLVDGRGLVWMADFGLARRLADPSLTQHDSLLGTPRYMSPEQARIGPIDGRSDLYSLGATLFELLTLRPPFEGRSAAELIEQIANQEPVAPRQFDPRVPRDLETIVLKLLAKRPPDRYESAAALAADLTRFLNYEPVRARRISPIGRAWRFARRHPGVTSVSATAAMTVLTVITVAYVKILHERDQAIRAVRTQLWREASVVRLSNVPERRRTGLALIRESAELRPEPALRAKLRDEAIEFLVMRDVEARPGFATGRSRGLAFSADGARLVTLTQSNQAGESVSVWDVSRRERIRQDQLRPPQPSPTPAPSGPTDPASNRPAAGRGGGRGPGRGQSWPLLTSAGQNVAVVAFDARGASQGVRLIATADGGKPRALKLEAPGHSIRGVLATPDGRRLVTVEVLTPEGPPARAAVGASQAKAAPARRPGANFVVNLWDTDRPDAPVATLLRTDPDEPAPTLPLVAVSPDGKTVATAWFHKTPVSLWAAADGEDLGRIETSSELTALALGPNNQLATAGSGEVRLWDTESRTALPSLTPNQSEVRLLRYSPRGSLLAVAGLLGRDIELWDTSAHSLVAVLPTTDPVEDMAFAPDGRALAAATTGETTRAWAVLEPDVRARIGGFDAVARSLAFRADGLLAMGMWKGAIRFRDEGQSVHARPPVDPVPTTTPTTTTVPAGAVDPIRDRPTSMVFDGRGDLITLEPDALRVWANPPRCPSAEGTRLPLPPSGRGGGTLGASADGRTLAIAREGMVFLRRSAEPMTLVPVKLPPELASRVRDFWGGRDRDPRRERDRGPDPNRGPGPGPDRGPDRGPGRPGSMLNWHALAVAPGGERLYLLPDFGPIDGNGSVQVWSLDGAEARSLPWPGLPTDATALALSPDGTVLAVGERSGAVALFDTSSGAVRTHLSPASSDSWGQVASLAFSPDGKEVAVGSQQGPIALWALADPTAPVLRLPGHRSFVASLAFDADGHHLASAGGDKTVDVWDLALIRQEFAKLGLAW